MAGLVEERVRFIASLPIFAKCSADFARQLAEDARPLALPQSFVLGRKGEPASAVFLLRRGRVKIMATTPEWTAVGNKGTKRLPVHNTLVGPGELLGLMSSLRGVVLDKTYVTSTACRLLSIDAERFKELASTESLKGIATFQHVVREWREMRLPYSSRADEADEADEAAERNARSKAEEEEKARRGGQSRRKDVERLVDVLSVAEEGDYAGKHRLLQSLELSTRVRPVHNKRGSLQRRARRALRAAKTRALDPLERTTVPAESRSYRSLREEKEQVRNLVRESARRHEIRANRVERRMVTRETLADFALSRNADSMLFRDGSYGGGDDGASGGGEGSTGPSTLAAAGGGHGVEPVGHTDAVLMPGAARINRRRRAEITKFNRYLAEQGTARVRKTKRELRREEYASHTIEDRIGFAAEAQTRGFGVHSLKRVPTESILTLD